MQSFFDPLSLGVRNTCYNFSGTECVCACVRAFWLHLLFRDCGIVFCAALQGPTGINNIDNRKMREANSVEH